MYWEGIGSDRLDKPGLLSAFYSWFIKHVLDLSMVNSFKWLHNRVQNVSE